MHNNDPRVVEHTEAVRQLNFEEASAQISRYADSDMVREAVKTTKLHKLPGCKGGAGDIVGAAVDAVAAVEGAAVGHEYLEQADAAAIGGKGVAAARGIAAAHRARARGAGRPAGSAGNVIFGAVRQNGKLVHQGLFHAECTSKGDKTRYPCLL